MPKTRSGSGSERRSPSPSGLTRVTKRAKGRVRAGTSAATPKPAPKPLSQFVLDLQSMPTTKHGLEMQCQLINTRLQKIRQDQELSDELFSEAPLGEQSQKDLGDLLQNVVDIPGFGPLGKVGLHIRKETLALLEEALLRVDVEGEMAAAVEPEGTEFEAREEDSEDDVEVLPTDLAGEDDLTKDTIQETFEGIDRDLLGVNSQAALDKISAFVTKTISENHPSKARQGSAQPASVRSGILIPVSPAPPLPAAIPPSVPASTSKPRPATKEPPFKFAFISVVATYDAKCTISLQDLHAKVRTITFDPTWFHSAVLTFPKSECRAAIFENGKFVITGVTTIKMALIAARNVLEIFKLCGYNPDISKRNFRAKNLTALMELGVNIDIAGFAEKHQHNTYMDQDTFGAVTHFPEKSPSTIHKGGLGLCMLIFATGKIVLVGGKTEKHMISVFRDKTLNILKPFAFGWS
ncbi:hypothetical protein BV898_09697 [Hypsibius exemplaris]|uniref:TATA-box-binding protein n=1 Tax=Hypsibius exemplaris TaxID=2072580 RepID=A0A1W0WM65_HYPEX|nr:hypothetical protein BV898_09697 [Hypsibius exemplaris]